jgi:transposase
MRLFPLPKLYNIDMPSDPRSASETASPAVGLTALEMSTLPDAKEREIIRLRCQVAWFQRQIFGQKSERRMPEPEGVQGELGEAFDVVSMTWRRPKQPGSQRTSAPKNKNKHLIDGNDDAALFFDESKVPVDVIAKPADHLQAARHQSTRLLRRRAATCQPARRHSCIS